MGITLDELDAPETPRQPADPDRDADRLRPEDWPLRLLPASIPGRAGRFQVVFGPGVVEDIRAHGQSSPDVEVCGVLVGNVYRDHSGPYCLIEANIRGAHAPGRNAQVTFTSETWTLIHETMDARYPDRRIVGWYHTHPGFGIFLSEMDLFIHENFFPEPWQVAYVDDPQGGDRGAFVWQKGAAVRQQFLVDTAADSVDAEKSPRQPTVAPGLQSASEPSSLPLDLSARFRTLQRQIDLQRSRARWLAAAAFLWPLALLAALFWAGLLPQDGLAKFVPGRWLPGQRATMTQTR